MAKLILTLADESAVTETGVSARRIDLGQLQDFVVELRATENSGTATLDVVIQDSFDGGTTWNTWVTFSQLAATGSEVIGEGTRVLVPSSDAVSVNAIVRPPAGLVRAAHTIGGTGNYSYTVKISANPLT